MRAPTAALLAAIVAASSIPPAHADILIGVPGPLTGGMAWFGEQMQEGIGMKVAELNAAGGVLGQQIELLPVDDYCDPDQAIAAAHKLVEARVDGVVGHFCSGAAIPASRVYEQAGVLFMSSGATNPTLTDPAQIVEARNAFAVELARLQNRIPDLRRFEALLADLGATGAPAWADALADPDRRERDLLPESWRAAWEWAEAMAKVEAIHALEDADALRQAKAELTRKRHRLFEELILARTLFSLNRRIGRVRLAVELDGDSFHGPERWADDMARQAALERAGWVFWRVFGSQWKADPDYRWRRLVERLEQCRIAPIGSAAINEVYTEHRVIRAGGKPVIVADPECVAHAVVGEGEAVEGADGRLATSVQPSATPAPKPEVEPAAEPVVPIPTIPLPSSPLSAAAPSEPERFAPSAGCCPALARRMSLRRACLWTRPAFISRRHSPEIVGPDMAIVLFYPETLNRRTIRISSQEDAPDSNVIHMDRPLARALIGATIDETVELEVSGKTIRMIVEQIYPHLEAAE